MSDKKILTIKRFEMSQDGIYGVFIDNHEPFCLTIENDLYLIPSGLYQCIRSFYQKGNYETFEIIVPALRGPKRERILFHKGVIEDHSLGCIITGERFERYKGKVAVFNSTEAFNELMKKVENLEEFYLRIVENY